MRIRAARTTGSICSEFVDIGRQPGHPDDDAHRREPNHHRTVRRTVDMPAPTTGRRGKPGLLLFRRLAAHFVRIGYRSVVFP
ncbi:hypothetical protein NJB18091_50120 [Mycobacterium marinum]|nr:hypothetical protein MMRN_36870 [Mycobacterium marinum]GJO08086.1 hypothetical protein NJB18091_50120 [Mycobacterium marinum]